MLRSLVGSEMCIRDRLYSFIYIHTPPFYSSVMSMLSYSSVSSSSMRSPPATQRSSTTVGNPPGKTTASSGAVSINYFTFSWPMENEHHSKKPDQYVVSTIHSREFPFARIKICFTSSNSGMYSNCSLGRSLGVRRHLCMRTRRFIAAFYGKILSEPKGLSSSLKSTFFL